MLRQMSQGLMLMRWPLASTIILAALAGCSSGSQSGGQGTLTVFAAASLTEAFTELVDAFERQHPGSSVELNFDGSQRLRFQLEHGAQADVFVSADLKQMDRALVSGLLASEIVEFASNRLVLIVPNPASQDQLNQAVRSSRSGAPGVGTAVGSLADLSRKGVKLALAQPEVPAGNYSRILIRQLAQDPRFGLEYTLQVLANVVTEEPNVRSVLNKVVLGEVDAGLVYYSDAQTASDISVIPVPSENNVLASYTVAALRSSDQPDVAVSFIGFIMSAVGQGILGDHAFGPPVPTPQTRNLPPVRWPVGSHDAIHPASVARTSQQIS